MTINNKTTFKELKKLVGSTKELAKLPTAKELRNSNEEIVFDGDVAGAHFIIYKSGLFIYSRSGHATVYAVDRCTEIEYPCVYLPDPAPADRTVGSERADGGGIQKKPRKSEREMTTPLFLLRCVQLGISIADLDLLTIGLVNDMFTERQNDEYPYKELASQEDFDRF